MLRGAAAGAMGIGIVGKLAKMGKLSKLGTSILSFHIAPVAYAIRNFGNYNAKGLSEIL